MHSRIEGLTKIFPFSHYLIDIGSDHGHLGLELLNLGKVGYVWNVELSKDALKSSRKLYKEKGLEDKASFLYSDGFISLKDIPEKSTVALAGLGTTQILRILMHMPSNINSMVVLSHTDYFELRKWAISKGWNIEREIYIDDPHMVYIAMYLTRRASVEKYKQAEFIFGKNKFWENNIDLFNRYWASRAKRILKIPAEYRSDMEKYILLFLEEKEII